MKDLSYAPPASKGLDELLDQHAALAEALDVLAALAEEGRYPPEETRSSLELLVRILDEYGCQYHFALEEQVVFPRVRRAGSSREGALLDELLSEHRQLYQRVACTASAVEAGDGPLLAYHVQQLYPDWAAHHARENDVLFPLAYGLLTRSEFEELDDAAEEFVYERYQWEWRRVLFVPLTRLVRRYLP